MASFTRYSLDSNRLCYIAYVYACIMLGYAGTGSVGVDNLRPYGVIECNLLPIVEPYGTLTLTLWNLEFGHYLLT